MIGKVAIQGVVPLDLLGLLTGFFAAPDQVKHLEQCRARISEIILASRAHPPIHAHQQFTHPYIQRHTLQAHAFEETLCEPPECAIFILRNTTQYDLERLLHHGQ